MLKNAYLDAKIGFDPAENEPPKEWCVVAGRAFEEPKTSPFLRAAYHGDLATLEKMVARPFFKAASDKVTVLGSVGAGVTTSAYSGLAMDGFYFVET